MLFCRGLTQLDASCKVLDLLFSYKEAQMVHAMNDPKFRDLEDWACRVLSTLIRTRNPDDVLDPIRFPEEVHGKGLRLCVTSPNGPEFISAPIVGVHVCPELDGTKKLIISFLNQYRTLESGGRMRFDSVQLEALSKDGNSCEVKIASRFENMENAVTLHNAMVDYAVKPVYVNIILDSPPA